MSHMTRLNVDPHFFHAEATLPPDSPSYVKRAADAALQKALRERKFVIMLSSRKVGKSSLMEQAFVGLQQEGIFVAKKELSDAGAAVTEEGWYAGLIQELVNDAWMRNQFAVKDGWREWWDAHGKIPAGQRFTDFLRCYFLEPSSAPWVIAIDEIDTTIPLHFSDDFFASVRRCQNARAADPLFGRLTFLLAGVASPAQLIKDNRRTPFNIGHAVNLTDFTADEACVLLRGLGLPEERGHPLLLRVLHWTGGHPYLTQRIFYQLALGLATLEKVPAPAAVADWEKLVDDVVGTAFLHASARTTEAHFQDIARRRIGGLRGMAKRRTLAIYARALRGKTVQDDALAAPIVELKLCGLLVCDPDDAARLVVRNRIYRRVFDAKWVRVETPRNIWQAGVAASAMATVLAIGLVFWQAEQEKTARIVDLSAQIERADADVPSIAFAKLKAIKGQERQADKLLGQYWANKARIASLERPREEAALLWLKALTVDATSINRLQARNALAGSLPDVFATLRHQGMVWSAAFSPDGRRVLTASSDKTARLWDAETGLPLGKAMQHQGTVSHAAFSPDGRRVITASWDNTTRLWDAETGLPLGEPIRHLGAVNHAAFSPDGRRVVTASDDKTARLWDAETGLPLGEPIRHLGTVNHAAFSPDGRRVITASDDNTSRQWDAETGQPLGKPMRHQNTVNHAAFSPDGRRVVTAGRDNTARLWNAESGQPVGKPIQHQDTVRRAAFSRDGRRVATMGFDNTVQLWDAGTGQPLGKPMRHQGMVNHAAFSPNGRRVVTVSADSTAQLWDAETGQPLGKPMRHEHWVTHAAFSPDGRRVVTASDDNTAQLWDAETGQPLGKPMRHEFGVNHAAFSPDGRRVVTASLFTAQLWDAETGQPLGKPIHHQDTVKHTAFSPDGRRLVTRTNQTLNWFTLLPNNEWQLENTVWANGGIWLSDPQPTDPSAGTVRIADASTGKLLPIRDIALFQAEPGLPELPGKPADLLARYQRTFALRFADENKSPKLIRVYYPTDTAK